MSVSSYQPLDEALDRLAGYGSELDNGNFNHAPMVAEALCALDRPQAVLPWIERYRRRLVPRAAAGEPIGGERWREELGRRDRFAAWGAFFDAALREADWRDLLQLWVDRLAPGVSAAAAHGAIRVGHAVRALGVAELPQRRRELADALASWAASYIELPTGSDGENGGLAPRRAIAQVAIVPPERRRRGNIVAALQALSDTPDFASVIGLADLAGEFEPRLAELTELFARVYLANVKDVLTAIVFIHGVTSLGALGHIARNLDDAATQRLLRYGWQAGCGLLACFGGGNAFAREIAAEPQDPDALVERALAHGDEHVVKFTEACLARHRFAPSPAYPAAIANVLRMMPAR